MPVGRGLRRLGRGYALRRSTARTKRRTTRSIPPRRCESAPSQRSVVPVSTQIYQAGERLQRVDYCMCSVFTSSLSSTAPSESRSTFLTFLCRSCSTKRSRLSIAQVRIPVSSIVRLAAVNWVPGMCFSAALGLVCVFRLSVRLSRETTVALSLACFSTGSHNVPDRLAG